MTITVIHKFDCEDCDKFVLIEQTESNMFLLQREELESVSWHLEISERDDNTQLFSHYCHKCWLERTILTLDERIRELQAEYKELMCGKKTGRRLYKTLRRLVLEQRLMDYVRTDEQPHGTRLFDCGPEFGIAHLTWRVPAGWCLEWRFTEECPVDLDNLPKETND